MKPLQAVVPVLGLLLSTADVHAAILPSFHIDDCSWAASHVVVVSEGDKIDGDVEVLESWKGNLKRGDRITVPELAAYAPRKKRVIAKQLFDQDKGKRLPKSVTCSRMVLFLIRTEELAKTKWLPAADWGGFMVSIAWIEADTVFACAEAMNPRPSRLLDYGMNECGLKCRVDDVVAAQSTLTDALRQNDAMALAAVVPTLLRAESETVRYATIVKLGASGAKSLPPLRGILQDEALLKYHGDAIRALAKAGGAAVGPDLAAVLKQELAFWKKHGPGLKTGWWNGGGAKGNEVDWDEVERLRNHCNRAYDAIVETGEIGHVTGEDAVIEFRNYWQSLPQLAEESQIKEASFTTLEKLQNP